MATINGLFPGKSGRMVLIRVMLRIKKADLTKMDPDAPLDPELESRLRAAIADVERG